MRTVFADGNGKHTGAPAEHRVVGELAPICSSTMDLDVIRGFAPGDSDLHHLLDMCDSLKAWEGHMFCLFDDIPEHFSRGTSRKMLKHRARLFEYGVVRNINRSEIKCVTNYFTVDKKDLTLRLVVDGRKVNLLMEKPPGMELPEMQEVINYLMSNRYALSVDGKSYFYQVPISDEVGSMFCANLAGTRGKFISVAMTRLPMGWSYAPAIAQKISNTLLRTADGRILGVAWIDNFIFAGKTEEEVAANYAEFLHRCDEANVKIDILDAKPKSLLTVLGIEFNLEKGTYRLDPEWVQKKATLKPETTMTPRALYEITGSLIWHDFVKRIPLCHQDGNIETIRRVAHLMAESGQWDTPIKFTDGEVSELKTWLISLTENAAAIWKADRDPELQLWCDASDDQWAALYLAEDELIKAEQGSFVGGPRAWHIFIKEAFAADKVISATKGISRLVNIDNLPLVQCIKRGFSANRLVNAFIKTWDLENIQAKWVSTKVQLTDIFTRGFRIPEHVAPLSPDEKTAGSRGPKTAGFQDSAPRTEKSLSAPRGQPGKTLSHLSDSRKTTISFGLKELELLLGCADQIKASPRSINALLFARYLSDDGRYKKHERQ